MLPMSRCNKLDNLYAFLDEKGSIISSKSIALALLAFLILVSLIGLNNAAFAWVHNYYNYINFTNLGSNGIFINPNNALLNINFGPVNWTYLNLSSIPVLSSLSIFNNESILLQGYNGSVFIGNISAYPYENGLLIPHYTINKKPYTSISLFFNQSVNMPTYQNGKVKLSLK